MKKINQIRLTKSPVFSKVKVFDKGGNHMATEVGKYLRKLRIDNEEILKNMADKLKVSSSFLSAIENGKKNMPESMEEKIIIIYNLDDEKIREFRKAVEDSLNSIQMDLKDTSNERKQLAINFARKFDSLDDDLTKQIFEMLKESDKGDNG